MEQVSEASTLDPGLERERLTFALEEASGEFRRYSKRFAAGAQNETAAIFDLYSHLLSDPRLRRELFEEAGITTGRVRYLSSQPWPFPGSLMIGCLAEATSETIVRDETELEDARWFSRAEVLQILERRHPDNLVAPGRFAIARVLVKAWARGGLGFDD